MTERDELFMRNTDAFSWYLEADPGLRDNRRHRLARRAA